VSNDLEVISFSQASARSVCRLSQNDFVAHHQPTGKTRDLWVAQRLHNNFGADAGWVTCGNGNWDGAYWNY
jgi:hypothetical protein